MLLFVVVLGVVTTGCYAAQEEQGQKRREHTTAAVTAADYGDDAGGVSGGGTPSSITPTPVEEQSRVKREEEEEGGDYDTGDGDAGGDAAADRKNTKEVDSSLDPRAGDVIEPSSDAPPMPSESPELEEKKTTATTATTTTTTKKKRKNPGVLVALTPSQKEDGIKKNVWEKLMHIGDNTFVFVASDAHILDGMGGQVKMGSKSVHLEVESMGWLLDEVRNLGMGRRRRLMGVCSAPTAPPPGFGCRQLGGPQTRRVHCARTPDDKRNATRSTFRRLCMYEHEYARHDTYVRVWVWVLWVCERSLISVFLRRLLRCFPSKAVLDKTSSSPGYPLILSPSALTARMNNKRWRAKSTRARCITCWCGPSRNSVWRTWTD